jgi:hypothetical protein
VVVDDEVIGVRTTLFGDTQSARFGRATISQ